MTDLSISPSQASLSILRRGNVFNTILWIDSTVRCAAWDIFYTFICIPGPAETAGNADFFVPHSLALIESRDTICVADREHGR